MSSANIEMLQIVAKGLGELKDEVVFVGGVVAELYADNPAASDIRPTDDVDCVIELGSRVEHGELEEQLRAIGFANDTSEGAPICRWVYQGIKVDVMPTEEGILGFSNRWYPDGIEQKITKVLTDRTEISVFSPAYYIAAKFEAHKNRGGDDLRASHDFEDIVYVLDNCTSIIESIQNTETSVKTYLKEECQKLWNNKGLNEGIECALPYGSDEEATDMVIELIQNITAVE
jgi:hypothetical protein